MNFRVTVNTPSGRICFIVNAENLEKAKAIVLLKYTNIFDTIVSAKNA